MYFIIAAICGMILIADQAFGNILPFSVVLLVVSSLFISLFTSILKTSIKEAILESKKVIDREEAEKQDYSTVPFFDGD